MDCDNYFTIIGNINKCCNYAKRRQFKHQFISRLIGCCLTSSDYFSYIQEFRSCYSYLRIAVLIISTTGMTWQHETYSIRYLNSVRAPVKIFSLNDVKLLWRIGVDCQDWLINDVNFCLWCFNTSLRCLSDHAGVSHTFHIRFIYSREPSRFRVYQRYIDIRNVGYLDTTTLLGGGSSISSSFCKTLFVLLYFFFWPLCCLFFDIRILITPLVSSNSSFFKRCNAYFVQVENQDTIQQ